MKKIKITWMDGHEELLADLDDVGRDKDGRNLCLYRTSRIGGPSELTEIIPLLNNVRKVEFLR